MVSIMNESSYLNYTHGSFLQNLFNEISDSLTEKSDISAYIELINQEMRNLKKSKSGLWDYTISQCCYYDFLQKALKLLIDKASSDCFAEITEEVKRLTRQKIYVLFLTQEPSCWPSLKSVFEAARKDPDYEAALIYTPFYHENFTSQVDYYDTYAIDMNLPVIRHNEYNLSEHSPDIVFMIKPYGNVPKQYEIKNLEGVVPRFIYIPYGMEITTDLAKYGFQFYLHYKAWKHCAYGEIVKKYAKKYGYRNGENIAVWGHPKADHYWNIEENKKNIPDDLKKFINGRKTILWTPHHLIDLNGDGTGTWLIWGEKILRMAINNPDVAFIIRPHPLMFGALINSGALTSGEVRRLKKRIESAENIMLDESSSYYDAFDAADAIISDGTTFCIEFLYTKKPIMLTPRNMKGFYLYNEMLESYYIARTDKDISEFISNIKNDLDPLCDKRIELYNNTFFLPEKGTVGEYIMENAKKELAEECKNPVLMDMPECVKKEHNSDEYDFENNEIPLLSVLVLCYKNMDLLYGMLDSIFIQDYPRIQLIVSDDGSEDFDVEAIKSYIDIYKRYNIESVVVQKNEKNMGTVRHIDKAFKKVDGEYFIFTAADDRFTEKDVFSGYVRKFLENPDAKWIVAKANLVSSDYNNIIRILPSYKDEEILKSGDSQKIFSLWCHKCLSLPCCMALKREAIDVIGGFDLSYRYSEDWPLILKLLRKGYAPVFFDKIVANHSMGGITNSNVTYGISARKAFYDDKYQLFKKEVDPYMNLVSPEDKKAYKLYMKEIMARHYFFFIDYPGASSGKKLKLFVQKPIRLWWLFEHHFMRVKDKIHRKKIFLFSQVLFLLSFIFFSFEFTGYLNVIADCMAIIDIIVAFLLLTVSIVTYPLAKFFKRKEQMRQDLVN